MDNRRVKTRLEKYAAYLYISVKCCTLCGMATCPVRYKNCMIDKMYFWLNSFRLHVKMIFYYLTGLVSFNGIANRRNITTNEKRSTIRVSKPYNVLRIIYD